MRNGLRRCLRAIAFPVGPQNCANWKECLPRDGTLTRSRRWFQPMHLDLRQSAAGSVQDRRRWSLAYLGEIHALIYPPNQNTQLQSYLGFRVFEELKK